MKKANYFKITNSTGRNIVFCPKEQRFRQRNTYRAQPESFVIVDHYIYLNFELDLDEWVFQFLEDDTEISVDDIHNHGVDLEYIMVEVKTKTKKKELR